MANTVIQLKHSTLTGNVPSSLANGEISINSRDGKFFYSTPAGTVVTHYPYPGPAGLNQEIQFNDSGVLGANAGLSFDKSAGALTVSGNVTTSQYFIGDGSKLTGLAPALQIYSLANTASGVSNYMVLKSLANYTVGTQNTTSKTVTTTPTLLTSFITDVGFPNITTIPSGDITLEFDTTKASGAGNYYCYAEVYKRTSGGVETLLETTGNTSTSAVNTSIQQRVNKFVAAPIPLDLTDRLVVKIYAVMVTTSASISISFDGAAHGAFTIPTFPASVLSFVPYVNATANVQLNSHSLIANTVTANSVVVANSIIVTGRDLNAYANAAFLQANTPSHVANSAASYANSAFLVANTPTHVANSAASYANSAFAKANNEGGVNTTQNTNITNAGTYANAAFTRANNSLNSNTGGTVTANTTFSGNVFLTGNGTTLSVTSNLSFISPNTQNTITARMINGGTLSFSSNSGELFSITDSLAQGSIFSVNDISGLPVIDVDANGWISFAQFGGNVHVYNAATSVSNSTGALVVDGGVGVKGNVYADAIYDGGIEIIAYANSAFLRANTPSHVANSAASYANSAFIHANAAFNQANTGGGGGTTDFGFGIIYTANNNTFANATTANAQVNFIGENGTVVYANATTKTITFAGTPGAQGLTVDYGFVNDPIYYSIDYGSLA